MMKALDYITTLEGAPNRVNIDGRELTLLEVKMPSGTYHDPWFQVRVQGVHWFEDGECDFDGQSARLHSMGVVSTPAKTLQDTVLAPGRRVEHAPCMHAYTDLYVRFVEDKVGITLADGSKV